MYWFIFFLLMSALAISKAKHQMIIIAQKICEIILAAINIHQIMHVFRSFLLPPCSHKLDKANIKNVEICWRGSKILSPTLLRKIELKIMTTISPNRLDFDIFFAIVNNWRLLNIFINQHIIIIKVEECKFVILPRLLALIKNHGSLLAIIISLKNMCSVLYFSTSR